MKSFKILIAAAAMMTMLFSGCQKEVFTGIDSSKAGVKDLSYDEINSSETVVGLYYDGEAAIKAGATSFSVQLAENEDFRDVDMYDSKKGQTIQATASVNDAVQFSGLKEYARYYARVRANYPRSIYSEWTVLKKDGELACISVGHGIIAMNFAAPADLTAESAVYSKINVKWGVVGLADGYEVEYKKSAASEWIELGATQKVTAEILDTEEMTSYDVRVKAYRLNDGAKEYTEYATTTVTTPQKPPFVPQISTADQLTTFFMTVAATASATDSYTLENDIDLAGASFDVPVEAFMGAFDGKNHTIKNASFAGSAFTRVAGSIKDLKLSGITMGNGFIGTLDAGASVSNVSLDKSCKVEFPTPEATADYGTLVNTSAGTVEKCTSAVAYSQTFATLPKASVNFGGIVGSSTGLVKDCENTGARAISVAAPETGTFHSFGGVVGLYSGEKDKVMVQNCKNSGAISVEYNTAVYFFTGGVAGGTPSAKSTPGNYGIIDNCTNSGAVSMHYITGGSGAYPNIGGVVGYTEGYIKSCQNSGAVSLACDSESATWTCVRLAGVAGTCTQGAYDCHNHGTLAISALVAGGTAGARGAGNISSSCFGGVVGAAGPYTSDGSVVFEKCSNDANLEYTPNSITETPNSYYGGVFGYVTGVIKDCENKGNVTVNSTAGINRLGGIAGGNKYAVEGCNNSGKLKIEAACKTSVIWREFLGGIIGDASAAGNCTITKCTNTADLTFKFNGTTVSTKICAVGGIVGVKKAGSEITFSECKNSGKLTADTNSPCNTDDLCAGDYN